MAENQLTALKNDYVRVRGEYQLDDEAFRLLTTQIAVGAKPMELSYFMQVCKRRALDPFSGQIYFVPRKVKNDQDQWVDKFSIQVSIDGFRTIAEKSGQLGGMDDISFDTEEGEHPNKATVTVYRFVNGQRVPFTATARWNEYVQKKKDGTPTAMWKKMGWTMLGKCAEALALRKAFPQDLGGLYAVEEMEQTINIEEKAPEKLNHAATTMRNSIMNAKPEEIPSKREFIESEITLIKAGKKPSLGLSESMYLDLLALCDDRIETQIAAETEKIIDSDTGEEVKKDEPKA